MTDGSTATDGPSMNRRTFIKGATLTATGAGAATLDGGAVGRSQAVAPLVIGAAAVGVGMVTGVVADHFLGNQGGELTGTEESQDLHAELYTRVSELHAADDTVLTTMSNRLEDSRNVVWPEVKKIAASGLNNGDSESTVIADAKSAVDDHYTVIQKNLLARHSEVVNSIESIKNLHDADSNLDHLFAEARDYNGYQTGAITSFGSTTATLADGSDYTFNTFSYSWSGSWYFTDSGSRADKTFNSGAFANKGSYYYLDADNDGTQDEAAQLSVQMDPWDTGSVAYGFKREDWDAIWTEVSDQLSQMKSNVEQYVTTLFTNYEPGELDPSDWMSGTDLASEFATDYESTGHHAYAAAEAAIAGVPGSSEQSMVIKLEDTGITVKGSVWSDWQPEAGSSSTPTATNTTTTSTATATDGSSSSGSAAFSVGSTYDPANTLKEVYLSYEYTGPEFIKGSRVFKKDSEGNWSELSNVTDQGSYTDEYNSGSPVQVGFTKLEQPFTITEAFDVETGNSVSTVSTESKNHQTADVTLTQQQMQQLTELREEMRENEQSGGGGGFDASEWSIFGIPGVGVIAGIGSAAALALGVGKAAMEQ